MKILFGANYCPSQKAEFARLALERLGHTVIPFTPVEEAPAGWMRTAPDVDMVRLVEGLGVAPDAFVMVESRVGTPFLPRRIADLRIPTAIWLFDNHLNFRWNKEIVSLFDHGFFAQMDQLMEAERYGCKNLHWLPFAADEVFHRNFGVERDIDIGYVGSVTDQKKAYFRHFEKSGLEITANDKYLSCEDVGRFYSRCKLVYNISARRDLNPRAFEASCAGALVLNQSAIDAGAKVIFAGGVNTVFHNFSDAPEICRKLLADDARRMKMARAAEELVTSRHTYRHRAQTIVELLSRGVTEERTRRRSTFLVPVAEGLTAKHPHFHWRKRGWSTIRKAFAISPAKTLAYMARYAWYRIKEKVWKIKLSLGKAPV